MNNYNWVMPTIASAVVIVGYLAYFKIALPMARDGKKRCIKKRKRK